MIGRHFPTSRMRGTPYDRTLRVKEYQEAASYMFDLGFDNGWVQERLGVELRHRPDFRRDEKEI